MNLTLFILFCYGFTQIVIYGHIFEGIRKKLNWYVLFCPMCSGFWVGMLVYVLFYLSTIQLFPNFFIGLFLFPCLSSGTSYFLCSLIDDEGLKICKK